ncbi:hypothetical protein [Streptomyces griseomycini]|uniref:Uncharacterized protein n=1 Tax=Streptomyces griseomycini TaxID=66895 RepID=A0A7W7PWJ7_9ACTN|nr:hypothetical protein [Streptomyces griseomycini]MBB4902583.1 hypothetical protein [Streptomyces griseomycini]GGR54306.1 hypothetical protein GCM10015536_69540 [Streptomyces griseomycini]
MASARTHKVDPRRAALRDRARTAREIRAAVKAVNAGPAATSAHLIAGGVTPLVAHNYAATITKKAKAADRIPGAGTTTKKRKGKKGLTVARTGDLARKKRHRVVPAALWTREDIRAVALTGYRPKNDEVAAFLAALALGRPAPARAAA